MSKLIDMLDRVGQQSPTPIGFGPASRRSEGAPSMLLIGQLAGAQLSRNTTLSEAQVDALLVTLDSRDKRAIDRTAKTVTGRLWGARVSGLEEEQAQQLKAAGCDYVIFDAEATVASVLTDEELGKIIAVGPDLNEDVARAIQELPIDAILFSPQEELLPLTVQKLIDMQIVRGLVDKPFVIATPPELTPPELQAFRNADIAGLMFELSSTDHVAEMREALSNLPRRKPRARPRGAIVPQVPAGLARQDQGGEEEDDDNDF